MADTEEPETDSTGSAVPPDGGWGWVIVLASGGILMSVLAFEKTITLFYQQLLIRFDDSSVMTATVMSVSGAMRSFGGPLASVLVNRFGHRLVGFASCGFFITSYIFALFAPSVLFLYFTYSVSKGIGIVFFVLTSQSIITAYFDKNKGKAMAVNSCFLGVGGLLGPMWLVKSYEEYGYQGTMIIMIALSLNIIPASLCFRPLANKRKSSQRNAEARSHEHLPLQSHQAIALQDKHQVINHTQMATMQSDETQLSRSGYRIKMTSGVSGDHEPSTQLSCCIRFLQATSLTDLCIPRVLLHMVFGVSLAITHGISLTFAAGFAGERHFKSSEVKLLLSLIFGGEIFWRIASGLLLDHYEQNRPLIYSMMTMCTGAFCIILPLIPGHIPLMCVWFVQQGFVAIGHVHLFTVVSDLVPRSHATSGIGLCRFFMGFGYIIGPIFGGILKDLTGSYKYPFQIAGAQTLVLATVCLAMDLKGHVYRRCCIQSKNEPNKM